MLVAVWIPRERIIDQPIKLSGFGDDASFALFHINLNLIIGPLRADTEFLVIDA